jgi:hypothetical protein
MAYQTGNIKYKGSFKSIRQWRIKGDPKTYAGEKGGANRDQIMHNAAFARTRENMCEFKGCGRIVKEIRVGLLQLIPEHTDTHFIGRLVALVKMINVRDGEGLRGKRGVFFSSNRPMLKMLTFHDRKKIDFLLRKCIRTSHPESRNEATITVKGLIPDSRFVPSTAQYYRVVNHINIISDYAYDETMKRYEPLSKLNEKSAFAYSDYTVVNTPLNGSLTAAFPVGIVLSESDTVMQCVGIEYYIKSGVNGYLPFAEGSMLVFDVF